MSDDEDYSSLDEEEDESFSNMLKNSKGKTCSMITFVPTNIPVYYI